MKKHDCFVGLMALSLAACSHNIQRLPASTDHSIEESALDPATPTTATGTNSCWSLSTRTKLQVFQIFKTTQSGHVPPPLSVGSYRRQLLDLYAVNESEIEWIASLSASSQVLGPALRFVQNSSYAVVGQASQDLKAAGWLALWLLATEQPRCREFFKDLMQRDPAGLGAKLLAEIQEAPEEDLSETAKKRDEQWTKVFQEVSELEMQNTGPQQKTRELSRQRFEVLLGFVAKEFRDCERLRSIASEVIESPLADQHQSLIQACRNRVESKLATLSEQIAAVERDLDSLESDDRSQRQSTLQEDLRSLGSQRLRYKGVFDTLKISNTPTTLQSLRLAELVQNLEPEGRRNLDIGFSIKRLRQPWQRAHQLDRSLGLSILQSAPKERKALRLQVSPHFAPSVAFLFEHGLL